MYAFDEAMSEDCKDPGLELAQWLRDVGRRRLPQGGVCSGEEGERARTSEEILQLLEREAGRRIRSGAELERFLHQVSMRDPEATRGYRRQRIIRETVLLAVLVVAVLQYYFLRVAIEIATLPHNIIYLPH